MTAEISFYPDFNLAGVAYGDALAIGNAITDNAGSNNDTMINITRSP